MFTKWFGSIDMSQKFYNIPTTKLNNGVEMPILGLGTWQALGKESEVKKAVKVAIYTGYRLIDCAHAYGNEKAIGTTLCEMYKKGVIKREDLFIVSKLWCNSHRLDLVEPAFRHTLQNLHTTYLDLYLIHWPMAFKEGDDLHPTDPTTGEYLFSDVDYVETWSAMEELYRKGLTRAIGVSNFNSQQIERLLKECKIFPQVNQIECHPYLNQQKLRNFCTSHSIVVMSYSPLGGPKAGPRSQETDVLNDSRIKEIAKRYKKTPAQIVLRYNTQLANVVIPKSSNKKRLIENIDIFDFYLALEDMNYINNFDCNRRFCRFDEVKNHIYYPFNPDVEF